MATLIPALGTCLHRMTSGEQRLAERLEHKLDDHFWLWYDVPIGPKPTHPDFVVQHRHCTTQTFSMHASKGLAWPVVAVLTAENQEKLSQGDWEMESKLAYVAATRSSKYLFLKGFKYAQRRTFYKIFSNY